MKNTVKKIYLVWYDQSSFPEPVISFCKAFNKKEDAQSYIEERTNASAIFVPSMTEEEYNCQDKNDPRFFHDYEFFIQCEKDQWEYYNSGTFYYSEEIVH